MCVRARAVSGTGSLCGAPGTQDTRFEHRKRAFIFHPASASAPAATDDSTLFAELTLPIDLPISHYLGGSKGLRSEALRAAEHKHGSNAFAIPAHSFRELLLEHALAPFFVFQVFCVVLWSLDDYW